MSAVTQWFPAEVKPVHVGFYQRQYSFDYFTMQPDYWNGYEWFAGFCGNVAKHPSRNDRPWRGLAEKPA